MEKKNSRLVDEGFDKVSKFLDDKQILKINDEINLLSKKIIFNGNSVGSVWFNSSYYDVYNPITNINSINLMELCIDISKLIFKENYNFYKLTNLRVSEEKNNSYPLKWHSDGLGDIVRVLIYLDDVDKTNGSLSVIKGSHKEKHKDLRNLDINNINKNDIEDLDCRKGDLIYFNPNIFHTKNPVKERKSIMMEFQHANSLLNKYILLIDNSKITEKVKNDISIFLSNNNKSNFELNVYSNKTSNYTPLNIYLKIFYNYINKKIFRKN